MIMTRFIPRIFKRWYKEEEALAAIEAAMVFPVMLIMLLGILDVGNGILANQKCVRASQVVADLVARNSTISQSDLDEAVEAGRLAFEPMDTSSYGVDIVSIRFDENANGEIVWRKTVNMTGAADPLASTAALAAANEGVVMVSVRYVFEPIFGKFVSPHLEMSEVAFTRGRSSAVVNLE